MHPANDQLETPIHSMPLAKLPGPMPAMHEVPTMVQENGGEGVRQTIDRT